MSVTVRIETSGLTEFGLKLRELMASFPVSEEKAMLAGAEVIVDEAKDRTKSEKTRPTIRSYPMPTVGARTMVIVGAGESGGSILPLLLEGGNGATQFTEWSHPVFGNEPDVKQKTQPYLRPAVEDKQEEMTEAIGLQIQEILNDELDIEDE